jgi:diguanylate cyclase (GGDEF)-like protein
MLPETTLQQASLVADRLLNRIKRDSFLCGESERIFVTVSIGYAACPDDADAGELLIKRAEHGVDIAKTKGKSKVCSYND